MHSRVTVVCLGLLAGVLSLSGCKPLAQATPTGQTQPPAVATTPPAMPSGPATPPAATTAPADIDATATPPTAVTSPPATGVPTVDPNVGVTWQAADTSAFTSVDAISDAVGLGTTVVAGGTTESAEAFGSAGAWYSLDGYVWQRAELPEAEDASIDAVSGGPSGVVAVGFDYSGDFDVPAVWRSADGRTWTPVSDADLTRGQMWAVAGDASGYVALGSDFDDGTSLAWTSPDGLDWSAASVVSGIDVFAAVNGLVATGSGFVAYGTSEDGSARMWHSADGREWQLAAGFDAEGESAINDVAVGGGRLLAVGARYDELVAHAMVWTSTDGIQWQAVEGLALDGEMMAVEPVGSGFYAVGALADEDELTSQARVWSSVDGLAWQPAPQDPSFELSRMNELLHAGPGLVIIGDTAIDAAGEEHVPAVWLGVPQ